MSTDGYKHWKKYSKPTKKPLTFEENSDNTLKKKILEGRVVIDKLSREKLENSNKIAVLTNSLFFGYTKNKTKTGEELRGYRNSNQNLENQMNKIHHKIIINKSLLSQSRFR